MLTLLSFTYFTLLYFTLLCLLTLLTLLYFHLLTLLTLLYFTSLYVTLLTYFTYSRKCRCVPRMGFPGNESRKQVDLVLKCSFLEKCRCVPKIGFGRGKKSVSDLVMAVLKPVFFENNKDLVVTCKNFMFS